MSLNALIKSVLTRAGFILLRARGRYHEDGLTTIHSDHFRKQQAFLDAYNRGLQATHGIDPKLQWRVHTALWAANLALRVPGDFVECGVNAGFISSAIMQFLDWNKCNREFFLIDSFAGPVPEQYSSSEIEQGRLRIAEQHSAQGAYVTNLDRVKSNFSEWPQARVMKGIVPDVLSTIAFSNVAFLHLDMNCAFPERAAIEFFWSKLSSGGVVLLDDYGYSGYSDQTRTIEQFAESVGTQLLTMPTGQAIIVKA